MGLIKTLAKIYGNYFLTVQGVKVMKTIKKDDNAVVGLGKLFIADKLMDTARWLIKPEDKNEIFLGTSCHYFYQTDYWDCEILLDDHLFCSPIAVLQDIGLVL